MKISSILLLLLFANVSPEIQYFATQRLIEHTPQHPAQTCLVAGPEVFAHAAPELADLRLYHDGTETPYVIHTSPAGRAAKESVEPANLGRRGQNISFDAAMPEGSYRDLELEVTGQDFLATVTVSGSQSQTAVSPISLGAYTIFDLTKQKLGRSTVLHLPKSDFRFLHFEIIGPLAPENIQALTFEKLAAGEPEYETVAESSKVTERGHASIIQFTVAAKVPVDSVTFVLGPEPASLSRNVTIAVSSNDQIAGGAVPPSPVTISGNLLRIHQVQNGRRIDAEHLVIDTALDTALDTSLDTATAVRNTAATWTVSVENGDDAPLPIKSVRLQMLRRSLCFEAAGSGQYTLYYGDPALTEPHYDYASLFTLQADAAQATAGPEQTNSAYRSRPDQRPFTERYPALLWAALVIVIASLAAIAFRSAKQTVEKG